MLPHMAAEGASSSKLHLLFFALSIYLNLLTLPHLLPMYTLTGAICVVDYIYIELHPRSLEKDKSIGRCLVSVNIRRDVHSHVPKQVNSFNDLRYSLCGQTFPRKKRWKIW